jgi:uncharacterized delta-60 repeat protein
MVCGVRAASLLDSSFQLDPAIKGHMHVAKLRPDGRILLGGVFTNASGVFANLVQLTENGVLDPSFSPVKLDYVEVNEYSLMDVVVLPDGKVMMSVGNYFSPPPWQQVLSPTITSQSRVVVISSDGTAVNFWAVGPYGIIPAYVRLTLRPGNRILIWGEQTWVYSTGGFGEGYLEQRLLSGEPDPAFTLRGVTLEAGEPSDGVRSVTVCTNGDLLLAGRFGRTGPDQPYGDLCLVRVAPDGTAKWSYAWPDRPDSANYAAEDANGEIVVVGEYYANRIARLSSNGVAVGPAFDPPYVTPRGVSLLLEDGRLMVSGGFDNIAGIKRPGIVALATDGSLDLQFEPGDGFPKWPDVRSIVQRADGRLILAGAFSSFDGQTNSGLIRLHAVHPEHLTFPANAYHLRRRDRLDECGDPAGVEIVRAGNVRESTTVRVSTVSGTAVAGQDFVPLDETVTFLPGERRRSVQLRAIPDRLSEHVAFQPDESFFLELSGGETPIIASPLVHNTIPIPSVTCGAEPELLQLSVKEGKDVNSHFNLDWDFRNILTNFEFRVTEFGARRNFDYRLSRIDSSLNFSLSATDNESLDESRELRVDIYDTRDGSKLTIPGKATSAWVTIEDDETPAGSAWKVNGPVFGFAPDAHGGLLVTGWFSRFGNARATSLARLEPSGAEDESFVSDFSWLTDVSSVVPLPDGRILVGGHFSQIERVARPGFARLNANGSLDTTFVPSGDFEPPSTCAGSSSRVNAVALDAAHVVWLYRGWSEGSQCNKTAAAIQLVSPHGELLRAIKLPAGFYQGPNLFSPNSDGSTIVQAGNLAKISRDGEITVLRTNRVGPAVLTSDGEILSAAYRGSPPLERIALDGQAIQAISKITIRGVEQNYLEFHSLLPNADGTVVVVGAFSPFTNIVNAGPPVVLLLRRDGTVVDESVYQLPPSYINGLGRSANGELYLGMGSCCDPTLPWVRFGTDYRPVNDMHIHRVVPTADGRIHFSFRGQALDGYALEASEDLRHWQTIYLATEAVTDQVFTDIPAGPAKSARFYRMRR